MVPVKISASDYLESSKISQLILIYKKHFKY
jgi:hypothetical protein